MKLALIAFNVGATITNAAHTVKRTAEAVVPSVTSHLVGSVDAVRDVGVAFVAGVKYANSMNKQLGLPAKLLTTNDETAMREVVEGFAR